MGSTLFFGDLVSKKRLAQLIDFENREKLFPAVDSRMKFCVLAMGAAERANFAFFLTNAMQLDEVERRFTLTADQIARINPNTKTAPVFRSRADAELTAKLYGRAPVLIEERSAEQGGDVNPWGITFQRMFDMSNDSGIFRDPQRLELEGWTREGTDWVRDAASSIERRVPLYEAKMIHHYDHRWATYAGGSADDEEAARDCTLAEKQNPHFEPSPRYWVPEDEVKLRAARVPSSLKRAYREINSDRCLKALSEWVAGYFTNVEGRVAREADLVRVLGKSHAWKTALGASPERFLLEPKTLANGVDMQRETPLSADDIAFLTQGPDEPLELTTALIERKQPRWLMGWRDITNATNERTVVNAVFPLVGTGDTLLLKYPVVNDAKLSAALSAVLSSMTLDYICRQKIGGTHLKYNVFKQNSVLPPSSFVASDLAFITPRVLELTYTTHAMRPWGEDLGFTGTPQGCSTLTT